MLSDRLPCLMFNEVNWRADFVFCPHIYYPIIQYLTLIWIIRLIVGMFQWLDLNSLKDIFPNPLHPLPLPQVATPPKYIIKSKSMTFIKAKKDQRPLCTFWSWVGRCLCGGLVGIGWLSLRASASLSPKMFVIGWCPPGTPKVRY